LTGSVAAAGTAGGPVQPYPRRLVNVPDYEASAKPRMTQRVIADFFW